jgi:segregation and condensation protein A
MEGIPVQIQIYTTESSINLSNFVSEGTWKDLLIELVKKNKLDPWNVDISEIVDKYIEAVKALKIMDLRIPANIILAASILLRFKSEALHFEIENNVEEEAEVSRINPSIEPLSFRLRIPPKRRVTLDELISALDEAMKLKEMKEQKRSNENVEMPLKFDGKDIEQELESLYKLINKNLDREGMTTFSALAKALSGKDILTSLFIPLLYLTHRSRIVLMQEDFFGEIIVALAS